MRSRIRLDELRPDLGQLPAELERSDHLDAVAPAGETPGELERRGAADVDLESATRSPIADSRIAAELMQQPFGRRLAGQDHGLGPGAAGIDRRDRLAPGFGEIEARSVSVTARIRSTR